MSHLDVMRSGVMFGVVISQISSPWFPKDINVFLDNSILYPMKTHPLPQSVLFNDIVGYSNISGVVHLDRGRWLGRKPGTTNLGDYHSKHHPTPHHIQVQHTNLHEPHSSQNTLQGCVNNPNHYTSLGLRKGLNTNYKQRDNNQFTNDIWKSS